MELYGRKTGTRLNYNEYMYKIQAAYPNKKIVCHRWSNSAGVFFYFDKGEPITGSDMEIGIWTNESVWVMTLP